ncbi:phage tail protein [Morganella morganii]|uniref:phage tail protein n=1 Tax=Morganella morganii TaxID=582 RepID=UPI002230324D|nr:phage tail protein [Morganella morganii]MDM8753523.1 phage tail protein [Morganella morganii]
MIYTDGTIAIKAGSPIVTGTGTQWKKNIHGVAPGQLISIENGTAPVSMMIRAVNSDTELVLSFNAPVTLGGAKYSIVTTVPDTISDAARTMSANQGYIVYFLQAMQQWMTDTGQVEIELPNGQKVTLDSIKALNEAISKIPKVVQEPGESKTDVMSQDGTVRAINAAKPSDASVTQKGIVRLSASVGTSETTVPHEKAVSDALSKKVDANKLGEAAGRDVYVNPYMREADFKAMGLSAQEATYDFRKLLPYDVWNEYPMGLAFGLNDMSRFSGGGYGALVNFRPWPDSSGVGSCFQMLSYPDGGFATRVPVYDATSKGYFYSGPIWHRTSKNTIVDGGGFLKVSSPIIQIHPDGNFDTNDESEGAEVRRTGTGQYHITGILGYNSDGAWGVNGGISVPKDNNGLELVYVDDRVQSDGSLIIETCHRQHAHLPERFQNWRLKEVTPEGERIFYQDGEPCDLPESTRLDVRVEMPQGSVWNVKQRELAEQMEREALEAVEHVGETEE